MGKIVQVKSSSHYIKVYFTNTHTTDEKMWLGIFFLVNDNGT